MLLLYPIPMLHDPQNCVARQFPIIYIFMVVFLLNPIHANVMLIFSLAASDLLEYASIST
jgi:hypothetical protein